MTDATSIERGIFRMGLFDRFKKGLQKSRTTLAERLGNVFRSRKLDESVFEEMEEAFIAADMGVETAMALVEDVRALARKHRIEQAEDLPDLMVEAMSSMLSEADSSMNFATDGPTLVLVVGVNGAGKTTSIGKLANYYLQQNKRVLLAAADTFRAAAIEQLLAWGERAGCDVVRHSQGLIQRRWSLTPFRQERRAMWISFSAIRRVASRISRI
ncbi:hypothetical protein GCM10025859_22000 [Alicyclobacillus fastidiosus]|nr:hypothetical protein GCM10025859_22000 [Alicyclobacillus fastidiosus]